MRNILVALAVLVLTLAGTPTSAQSTSALLEKGIYTEQTVGDIDKAIEIYQEIVDQSMAHRPHVAEALFRLGMCHLKSDDAQAAREVFEQIIADHSDQERFAVLAKENMPEGPQALELLPAPWSDGEVMRLTLKFTSGTPIGTMLMTADSVDLDGEEMWRLRVRRRIFSDMDNQAISEVFARKDSMAPVSSVFKHSVVGHFEADYDDGSVHVTTVGTDSERDETFDVRVFDNESGFHLFRRMPLEEGYKANLHVFAAMAGGAIPIEVEVAATEMITVPAGEFECYRVKFNVPQTFWYSTEPPHALVKFESSGVIGELDEVIEWDPDERLVFRDEQRGFDVSVPPDWQFYELDDGAVSTLLLLDPNADTRARVEFHQNYGDGACSAQSASWRKLGQAREVLHNYVLRDGSWHERKIADRGALSFIGDYLEDDHKMVHYWTFVDSGELCLEFTLKTRAELFHALREEFDTILESYEGPRAPVTEVAPPSPSEAAVKTVVSDFHLAIAEADTRYLDYLAPDLVFLGSDPTERLDLDAFRAIVENYFSPGDHWVPGPGEQHVVVAEGSDMAWFDERLESDKVGEMRASGVLRSDDGRWRIVQYHLAFPVPNALADDLIGNVRALGRVREPAPLPENDPAAAARAVLDDLNRAKATADRDRFFGHIAADAILMGTDRSERFTLPQYRAFVEPYFARGVHHDSVPLERGVYLSPDGKIAWFDELIERSDVGVVRGTGVLRQVDGTWRIVHYNMVFPVPNELSENLVAKIHAFYARD